MFQFSLDISTNKCDENVHCAVKTVFYLNLGYFLRTPDNSNSRKLEPFFDFPWGFKLSGVDWTHASTDCESGVGETIKREGGVSQACLGKSTSCILDIHKMVNWQLSKPDRHWPVLHGHIAGSCVNSSRWRDLFGSCPLTSCFTSSQSMFNLILSS